VPGEALSCLAIVRLPFAVPTDPIFAARSETFDQAFTEYSVPDAILRFRQGFGRLIRTATVSVGSLDSSIVHPREVFKEAISASAASVIFVHNHPSGDPGPSPDDIELTRRLVEAGKLLGIVVLDHVIVGDGAYLSLKGSKDLRFE
jgi:proteasome lid subunit RPN8/RPN11